MAMSALGQVTVTQPAAITINDNAPATPYPSTVVVSNVPGVIEKVTVTLNNVTHGYANDIGLLLVGPGGTNTAVLVNNAGGGASLNGASFTIDPLATAALPQFSALTSGGTFAPGDYSGTAFPAPAPGLPYGTLAGFTSAPANGTWSLYALDGSPLNSGSIGSWSLNLYTTPGVTLATNVVTLAENGSATLNVNVSSASVDPGTLKLSATSTNPLLIKDSDIVAGGSGSSRTLTFNPQKFAFGTNTVTVKVSDGLATVTTNLTLAVQFVNQPPTVGFDTNANYFYNLTTTQGVVSAPVQVQLFDADTEISKLKLFVSSSNTNVVANTGVSFSVVTNGAAVGPFVSTSSALTVIPNGAATGFSAVTVYVTDGVSTNFAVVNVTVGAAPNRNVFGNSAPVALAPASVGAASTNVVSGVVGLVGKVTVALDGIVNVDPSASTFVLAAPDGTKVTLLSTPSLSGATNYAQLTFADSGSGTLPAGAITNVTLTPVQSLSALAGQNPNGNWTLYATNAGAGTGASINNGWVLNIYPAPTINAGSKIADVSTPEESPITVSIPVGSAFASVTNVTAKIADVPGSSTAGFTPTSDTLASVSVSTNLSGNVAVVTLTPKANIYGTNTVTLIAQDNQSPATFATNSFKFIVTYVNHRPTVSFIAKQVTRAGVPILNVPFTYGDIDNPIPSLKVTLTSDNQKLFPDASSILTTDGTGKGTISLFPVGNISGTANVTVTISDGSLSASQSFVAFVQDPGNPLYASGDIITVPGNSLATPYPSVIPVKGLVGNVAEVQVSLFGLVHPNPNNLGILLVGPAGQKVLLSAGAGGTAPVTGQNIILADSASQSLPNVGGILSGVYKPTANTTPVFTNAPVGPYATTLSAFLATNPNGNWSLYVIDTSASGTKGGVISGWQLSVRTAPALAAIADQKTTENKGITVPFVVGDEQPGAPITVTATPADTTLLQPITSSGAGANRLLTINPVTYASGKTTVKVVATDGVNSSTNIFAVEVVHVDQPPVLTGIKDQTTPAATLLAPVTFTGWDPQNQTSGASSLSVSIASSDETLIPTSGIVVGTPTIDSNGTNTFSISNILPLGVNTGTATLTVTVGNKTGQKASFTFNVVVTQNLAFANTAPIIIPEGLPVTGAANPYPSAITVRGLDGLVQNVSVTLVGFNHKFPKDVNVLLVSPDGKSIALMGKAGGGNAVSNLRLSFSDSAGNALPTAAALVSQSYLPGEATGPALNYPAPAPKRPDQTSLSGFRGINPNGDWKLFVVDDTFPDGGSITGGWILFLDLYPTISTVSPQTVNENGSIQIPFTVASSATDLTNLVVEASITGSQGTYLGPVNLFDPNVLKTNITTTGSTRTLTASPLPNLPSSITYGLNSPTNSGTNTITLTVKDKQHGYTNATSFPLYVNYINQAPSIGTATNSVTFAQNTPVSIDFSVTDVDSILGSPTNITFSSSNPGLIPTGTNLVVTKTLIPAGTPTTVNVQAFPVLNKFGSSVLSFIVTDNFGNTTATNVTLNVTHVAQPPTISGLLKNYGTLVGVATTNIAFKVSSVEVDPGTLKVTAVSDTQGVVPDANIILGSDGANGRTVQLIPVSTGSAVITLSVDDGISKPTTFSFKLTVSPAPITIFANNSPITIPAGKVATPYGSVIPVSGLVGKVFSISATIEGLNHPNPKNLDFLLVSPSGATAVMLASGVGGTNSVNSVRLVLDDTASTPLPNGGPLVSGKYSLANYTTNTLPAPAPTNGYKSTLAAFAGGAANGNWTLYINDHGSSSAGSVANGWSLLIETTPTIDIPALSGGLPLVITESIDSLAPTSGTVTFSVIDTLSTNLVITASSDNQTLVPDRNIAVSGFVLTSGATNTGDATLVTAAKATISPAQYQSGTNKVTFTVTRTSDGASSSITIPVQVPAQNVPPTFTRIGTQSTPQNTALPVGFLVFDPDTPLKNLSIVVNSDNEGVISSTNITIGSFGTNKLSGLDQFFNGIPFTAQVALNVKPNLNQNGTANVTVAVTDPAPLGTAGPVTVKTTFTVNVVKVNYAPVLSSIGDQAVGAGSSTPAIPFTVSSVNIPTPSISVTATSSDQTLVKDSNIVLTGSGTDVNRTIQITAEPNVKGAVTIAVNATDGTSGAKTTFTLNVRPSRELSYANTNLITIVDHAPANPYPSSILVDGLQAPVSKITVTVNGFSHRFPSDVGLLLVGPNGKSVVLANKVGQGSSVTNLNITFDQNAVDTIPNSTALPSNTTKRYVPHDYKSSGYNFPTGAPVGPYTNTSLSVFNGTLANGTWSLYVVDDTPSDAGVITGGWSIGITTQPVVNGLVDLATSEDQAVRQSFTVADDSPSGPVFSFDASAADSSIISKTNIVYSGSGTNWTVTITPNTHAFGKTTITQVLTDVDGLTATNSFKVDIARTPYPPVIADVPTQNIPAGGFVTIPLTISEVNVDPSQITVSVLSDNDKVITANGLKYNQSTGKLFIAPVAGAVGSATVTVVATGPASAGGLITKNYFLVNVIPTANAVFANSAPIVINDNAPASPYPASIGVSNVNGLVLKATVNISGLTHKFPSDVSVLLVAPNGKKVVLLSRAGGGVAVNNTYLSFDDDSTNLPPQSGLIVDGTYRPTDYKQNDSFFAPLTPPYDKSLKALAGINPNGTWSLYVQDDVAPDGGTILGGWSINLVTTAPTIAPIAAQTVNENGSVTIPVSIGSPITATTNLTVSVVANGSNPAGLVTSNSFAIGGTGAARTLTITPTLNLPSAVTNVDGTTLITVAVNDGGTTSVTSFPLTVKYVNQAPVISGLADTTTPANVAKTVSFTVSDVQVSSDALVVTASGSDSTLGAIDLTGSNGNAKLTFTPSGTLGTEVVTVVASNGTSSTTNSFSIVITAPVHYPPVVGDIADQVTKANTPVTITLPITPATTPLSSLVLSSSASNPGLIGGVAFTVVGSTATATITPASGLIGSTVVTIRVADGDTVISKSFGFTVNAPSAPVIAAIADQTTKVNAGINIPVGVVSPDTAISNLVFTATASNTKLVTQVVALNTGTNLLVGIGLGAGQSGAASITVTANDGYTTVSRAFTLVVNPLTPPTLGVIANQSTGENIALTIPLAVNSPDTKLSSLSFGGVASDTNLISGVTVVVNGTNVVATVTPVANKSGSATISISVTDGTTTDTKSFAVTVNAGAVPSLSISLSGTTAKVAVKGTPNAAYAIQGSKEFGVWTQLTVVTADATGSAEYDVDLTSETSSKFFRAVAQ
jgi:subtilisin-like proprotein convertase family protein